MFRPRQMIRFFFRWCDALHIKRDYGTLCDLDGLRRPRNLLDARLAYADSALARVDEHAIMKMEVSGSS